MAPLVPLYALALGASLELVGVMEFLFASLTIAGAYLWGRASDLVRRRKPFIVAGIAMVATSLGVLALARDTLWLLVGRSLMGFGVAATVACGGALAAESGPPHEVGMRLGRWNGWTLGAHAVGLLASALLVTQTDLRTLFILGAAFTVVSVVLALTMLEEPVHFLGRDEITAILRTAATPLAAPFQRRASPPLQGMLRLPSLDTLRTGGRGAMANIFLIALGGNLVFVLLPVYLVELGVPLAWVPVVFLGNAAVGALASGSAGRLVDRVGPARAKDLAAGVRAGAMLLLALPIARGFAPVMALASVVGAGWSVVSVAGPVALLGALPTRNEGEVLALFSITAGVATAVGGLLAAGVAGRWGFPALFLTAAIVTLASVPLTHLARGR